MSKKETFREEKNVKPKQENKSTEKLDVLHCRRKSRGVS